MRRIPSNFVTKVSNSPRRFRSKTTASFYIGYCDDPDGVECDDESVEGCSFQHTYSSGDNSGNVSNYSLNENDSIYGDNFKSFIGTSKLERRSSDIDELRISALENIDKDKLVCKSAECLLNDYGDMEPLNQKKKQRSCELLDINCGHIAAIDSKSQKSKRGHLRSKSANLVKQTILKQYKNHLKKDKLKHGKSTMDLVSNPQITVTNDTTDNLKRKSHTLPRSLDASKLERLDLRDEEVINLIKHDKRKKKREKLSNMLNSMAGDKKEIMRYNLTIKNSHGSLLDTSPYHS